MDLEGLASGEIMWVEHKRITVSIEYERCKVVLHPHVDGDLYSGLVRSPYAIHDWCGANHAKDSTQRSEILQRTYPKGSGGYM